jgi:hypothetical protein
LSKPTAHHEVFAMSMLLSRRCFLGGLTGAAGSFSVLANLAAEHSELASTEQPLDFPLVDYHCHLNEEVDLDKAIAISKARGVKFGIVVHAGTKANPYPDLISDDDGLKKYLASLEGKPVYKGIQAEGLDWMSCFSKDLVAQLDHVLSDAMTFEEKDGRRVRLWGPDVRVGEPQDFMDRYVDYHVKIMAVEPLDILANPTYLPAVLVKQHDELWTEKRMRKIIDAAVKYRVAIEINSGLRLPKLKMVQMAKEAGAKFSFGSNIRGPRIGTVDYGVEMARKLGLTREHMFAPAPAGKKPIQVR